MSRKTLRKELVDEVMEFVLMRMDSKLKGLDSRDRSQREVIQAISLDVKNAEKDVEQMGCSLFPSEFTISQPVTEAIKAFAASLHKNHVEENPSQLCKNPHGNTSSCGNKGKEQLQDEDPAFLAQTQGEAEAKCEKAAEVSTVHENNLSLKQQQPLVLIEDTFLITDEDSFVTLETKINTKLETLEKRNPSIIANRPTDIISPTEVINLKDFCNLSLLPQSTNDSHTRQKSLDGIPLKTKDLGIDKYTYKSRTPIKKIKNEKLNQSFNPTVGLQPVQASPCSQMSRIQVSDYGKSLPTRGGSLPGHLEERSFSIQGNFKTVSDVNKTKESPARDILYSSPKKKFVTLSSEVSPTKSLDNSNEKFSPCKERSPLHTKDRLGFDPINEYTSRSENSQTPEPTPMTVQRYSPQCCSSKKLTEQSSTDLLRTPSSRSRVDAYPPNESLLNYYYITAAQASPPSRRQ